MVLYRKKTDIILFQLKAKKEKKKKDDGPGKKVSVLNPPPEFIAEREALWTKLKAERVEWLAQQKREPITYVFKVNLNKVAHGIKSSIETKICWIFDHGIDFTCCPLYTVQ